MASCSSVGRVNLLRLKREKGRQEMAEIGQTHASGRWLVNAGSEEEFIERWTTFTQWSLDNAPGTESFTLLRDTAEPRKFLSIGAFESGEAFTQWREIPEFTELRDRCIEVCEEFEPHEYTVAASPSR
jgi:heme-degrading monooxygenase HmoA